MAINFNAEPMSETAGQHEVGICSAYRNTYLFVYASHTSCLYPWARILVQVTINRRLLIGRDGHLDQSEAYDLS